MQSNWIRLSGVAALAFTLVPQPAEACGGLFCNVGVSFPVAQSGESVVFAVDRDEGLVEAVINVQYQGMADEFAWVLPLQSAPLAVDVAPSAMFATIDRLTAPQFRISRREETGICVERDFSLGANAAESLARIDEPANGVQVLQQSDVGPYESVVIQSTDTEALRTWLVDNGYSVTDEMMSTVTPYVTKGDTLLALKLRKNNDVGDIQPVVVTMEGDEVCIPIRLTAIAALEDMEITTLVLSNEGRAIPENYNHVTLNLAKIDWLNFGANYRQVVSQAADEGSGNAFTTEFSGASSIFDNQIAGNYRRPELESTTSVRMFVQTLGQQGLLQHREIVGILVRHLPDSAFAIAGTSKDAFQADPTTLNISNLPDANFDPREAVEEIWERIVLRERQMQAMFDRYSFATRLYTLISPEEMTIDPTFEFRTDLPDVQNVHTAVLITDCGAGSDPNGDNLEFSVRIDETGQLVRYGRDRSLLDAMPAAEKVEQLNEGTLITDNSDLIADFLTRNNSGCGCAATEGRTSGFGALFLLGLAFLMRRRGGR